MSQSAPTGYRLFLLTYRHPADHRHPGAGTYEQRLTLLHRADHAPVVLATNGYPDWSDLTSRQDATDQHPTLPALNTVPPAR